MLVPVGLAVEVQDFKRESKECMQLEYKQQISVYEPVHPCQ